MEGNQAAYRPKWLVAGLFVVQLLSCQPPGADSRSTDKTPKSGDKFLTKKNVVTHALDLTTKYAQPMKVVSE